MKREKVIEQLKEYFTIQELVSPDVYYAFGDTAWKFFDIKILQFLLDFRIAINKPIIINTWHVEGNLTQRGLRVNIDSLVKDKTLNNEMYISPHIQGRAIDFDVQDTNSQDIRIFLLFYWNELKPKPPFKIRVEKGTKWVHVDVIDEPQNPYVYFFKP